MPAELGGLRLVAFPVAHMLFSWVILRPMAHSSDPAHPSWVLLRHLYLPFLRKFLHPRLTENQLRSLLGAGGGAYVFSAKWCCLNACLPTHLLSGWGLS